MRTLMTALAFLAATPAIAAKVDVPTGRYVLDPAHTSVTWRITHLGLSNYTARLTRIASTLDLDAADVAKSKLAVTIDAKSVKTDFPFPDKVDFDGEIATKFLDAGANPEIKFVSTGITVTGAKAAKLAGTLTLKGITKPIVLDVVFNGTMQPNERFKEPKLGVSATGKVRRADYGIAGDGFLGSDIDLLIEAEYTLSAK